jgi:dTDP-4-dehydrorhamnose reductase
VSYYGLSKLKSEEVLMNSKINFAILRTIFVCGKVFDMSRSNIVLWIKQMLEAGKEITVVNDQYRMPKYFKDLARACKIALDKRARGVYHISSNELFSVYEITKRIAEVFQLYKSLIKPISSSSLNQKAKRPSKTGFDLSKTHKELDFYPRPFKESLLKFREKLV